MFICIVGMKRVWRFVQGVVGGVCLGLLVTTPVLADDTSLQQQIETLQQRVERLETEPVAGSDDHGITLGGLLSAAWQYQLLDSPDNNLDGGHGGLAFQPEVGIALSAQDELFFKFGFAAGNGLSNASPFNLATWAAPLEDDVRNINGRNRDYLLTAWYAHTFVLGAESSLQLTGGIIDATDYLDENAYSNDEHTQFMNEALVNGPNAFMPSFDLGGAAVLKLDHFEFAAVAMNIGENDDGNSCNYYGVELQYDLETGVGDGGYRIIVSYTTEAFLDPAGLNKESRFCTLLSFDQELGENFGVWTRFGFQTDKAAINYGRLFSGGVDLNGNLWGRQHDNIGLGYAFLDDGNLEIDTSQVVEAYSRFVLNDFFALTLDVQYLHDKNNTVADASGYVFGARGTVEF